jgi:hypothetical protein
VTKNERRSRNYIKGRTDGQKRFSRIENTPKIKKEKRKSKLRLWQFAGNKKTFVMNFSLENFLL